MQIQYPSRLEGDTAAKLEQLWTYLFYLAEQLNVQRQKGEKQ